METPTKSYKPKEVAEKLGCTTENIYRLVKYGQLKAFYIGKKRNMRITDKDLQDFLERMEVRKKEFADG